MQPIATGENVLTAGVVGGRVMRLESVEDVLAFLDEEREGIIALTPFAGSTFLSPIMESLVAILTITGTRTGHLAIVSREFRIPCVLKTTVAAGHELLDGQEVLVDTRDESVARVYECPVPLLRVFEEERETADLQSFVAPGSSLATALDLLHTAGYVQPNAGGRYALTDAGRAGLARARGPHTRAREAHE